MGNLFLLFYGLTVVGGLAMLARDEIRMIMRRPKRQKLPPAANDNQRRRRSA